MPEYDFTDHVDGNGVRFNGADAQRDETDDTAGHCFRRTADGERDETDDTHGHGIRRTADGERDEDDTEGHSIRAGR